MSYEQPDKGAKFTPSDHPEWLGKLFLIWPESVETVNFNRPDGTVDPTEMVTADVAIIDLNDPETGKPTFLASARIGGSALAPQIKKKLGKKVLGRLAQTPRQGNKSGAFFIADFTPQDVQWAEQYEAAFPRQSYQAANGNGAIPEQAWGGAQPAPAAPPAAPSWGAPAAPAAPAAAPPAAGWGAPAAPATPPPAAPAQAWGAQPPAAAPPAAPAGPPWPDGLREFLESRGIATAGMDEGTARQIAATLPS